MSNYERSERDLARLRRPLVLATLIIAIYLPIAFYLQFTFDPDLNKGIMRPPFKGVARNAYASYYFVGGATPDSAKNPTASTLQLYEDKKPLGPAHSSHYDITTKGEGRYSQWSNGQDGYIIIFSTSDNSDPNTNGRTYRAVLP